MKNTIKKILVVIILMLITVFATYSIFIYSVERPYADLIRYSPWSVEIVIGTIGFILTMILLCAFFYLYFVGVKTVYEEHLSEYNISQALVWLFSIWILLMLSLVYRH